MSSPVLLVKPEDVDTAQKRGKYTVAMIGCSPDGVLHACLYAEAGFRVTCTDADQAVVNQIARGRAPFMEIDIEAKLKKFVKAGQVSATIDVKTVASQSDIIVIGIPVKIDERKKPDYSEIESLCKRTGSSLRCGSLVIVANAYGLNVTDGLVRELLENTSGLKVGTDIGLAFSPTRSLHQSQPERSAKSKCIVAATDQKSLDAASTILGTMTSNGVCQTHNVKAAEALVLFEAVQRNVHAALSNEFALFCEKAGVDCAEVNRLADVGNNGFSVTLTEGNQQAESHVFLDEAENLNARLQIPKAARDTNEEIAGHAVTLAKDGLRSCGKAIRRARISVLGITQTPNAKGSPKKVAIRLVKLLEAKGARVSLYDPHYLLEEQAGKQSRFKKSMNETLEGADCIMIVTGHDQFRRLNLNKLKLMMRMPAAIIDFEGATEPDKVEKAGFIYRGFGRGVWTK